VLFIEIGSVLQDLDISFIGFGLSVLQDWMSVFIEIGTVLGFIGYGFHRNWITFFGKLDWFFSTDLDFCNRCLNHRLLAQRNDQTQPDKIEPRVNVV
jgi:hypothetical protein